MWMISNVITKIFDGLLLPVSFLPPIYGLIWISLLTAVGMLLVYRHISDQDKIKHTKNLIKAHFLEVRLFKEDFGLMMRAQKEILVNNFKYMALALKPLAFMLLPIILVLVQLEGRYASRPLLPGEKAILTVALETDPVKGPQVSLTVPEGLVVETPPVRAASSREVSWRLAAKTPGDYPVTFKVGDQSGTKQIHVGEGTVAMTKEIKRNYLAETILQPFEKPLVKSGPFDSVKVQYPDARLMFLGWNLNWLVGFFLFSIVLGFAMKGFFKVEI